jgi:CBS domain-containing protein
MRAQDLAERLPLVTRDTDAVTASQVLAEHRLAGLVVADDRGLPVAVVSGTQILRLVVPHYVLDDPALAHVYDEAGSAEIVAHLREHKIGDLLDDGKVRPKPVPSVLPDDTLIEIATLMCSQGTPVVLVRSKDGTYHGVITLSRLTAAILATIGASDEGVEQALASEHPLRPRPGLVEGPDGPSAGGDTEGGR